MPQDVGLSNLIKSNTVTNTHVNDIQSLNLQCNKLIKTEGGVLGKTDKHKVNIGKQRVFRGLCERRNEKVVGAWGPLILYLSSLSLCSHSLFSNSHNKHTGSEFYA